MTENANDFEQIATELREHEVSLFSVAKQYRTLAKEAATKRVVYDVAWANAINDISRTALESGEKITVADKDALATRTVAEQMEECRLAEAELDAAKKYIDTMQTILSSVQTRSKLITMEMSLAR